MTTPLTSAHVELDLLQKVVSEHGLEAGLESLCLGLSGLFHCQVRVAVLDPDGQLETPPAGSQTEWLEVQGHSYGLFIIRDQPLSPNEREHARILIDISERWLNAVSEIKRLEDELSQTSRVDPLTRLANRRYFEESLRQSIARSARSGQMLACMHIDLIGFKKVNETLGEDIGDEMLFALAESMQRLVRADDVIGRIGADEFAVLLNNVGTPDNVAIIVDRFQSMLSIPPIPTDLWKGARIGISIFPLDGQTEAGLLDSAAVALNSTKSSQEAVHAYYHELPASER
ncbi:MAG: diguanylate cyclase domain-containing protein [Burkholderiaceae bacterium]